VISRVALQHDGVESAVDGCERVRPLDERRLHPHVDSVTDERRDADEPDHHPKPGGGGDVRRLDRRDAPAIDVLEEDARAEGDGREDRHLRRRVGPADVVGRVGLREPESLGLRESLRVRASALHLREHEVRRSVDDAENPVHVRRHERLPQDLHDRDGRADRCLEAKLDAGLGRDGEELRAVPGHELLVGGDDRLAGAQQLAHVAARRLDSAHHLGNHRDLGIVPDRGEVAGEDA
jgi:hypothetical protein